MLQETDQKQDVDNFINKALERLKSMAKLLIQEVRRAEEKSVLLSHQKIFTDAVDGFWHNVKNGIYSVNSLGSVRVIRDIACLILPTRMQKPHLDCENIVRELKLIINTVDNITN